MHLLKKNAEMQKQQRAEALVMLRFTKVVQKNILKQCFDELRINHVTEKFNKATHELYNVELPRKEALIRLLKKLSEDD